MNDDAPAGMPAGHHVLTAVLLATLFAALAFTLEGHLGLDLNDEGFLWVGTTATAAGAVPLRDFQSYEPARYYWGALWFWLLRDQGLVSLRLSLAAFEAIGLTCGLLVLRRLVPETALLGVAGLVLALWVEPRIRVFEISITLVATLVGVRLLERPTARRYAVLGLVAGLSPLFGRNHAIYLAAAGVLLFFFSLPSGEEPAARRIGALAAGALVGAAPFLAMVAFVPGFREALARSVELNLEQGSNLARGLIVPGVNVPPPRSLAALPRHFVLGVLFVLLPAAYAFSAFRLLGRLRGARRHVLGAATMVGTVYLHHIYSRPDTTHLASGIAPFFVLVPAFLPTGPTRWRRSWTLGVLLLELGISAETIVKHHPLYQERSRWYVGVKVLGDHLLVDPEEADLIRILKGRKGEIARDEDLFVVPDMPGLYPALRKKAPVWRLQYIFPEPLGRQDEIVSTLERKGVRFALVCDMAFDGRDDLRFRNTFPRVFSHLQKWDLAADGLPEKCELRERPGAPRRAPPP